MRSNAPALPSCESLPDFDELALPLFNGLYSFARWLARSEADTEDLVQETYLKAFRSFATFQPGTNFQAWIFRILKNTFLTSRTSAQSRLTSLSNSDEVLADLPSDFPDPDTVLMDRVRLDALQTAMQQLPLSLREVLVSCDLEQASYRETAQALSIPVGTVMSRLARARKALRESVHAIWHPLPGSSALRELEASLGLRVRQDFCECPLFKSTTSGTKRRNPFMNASVFINSVARPTLSPEDHTQSTLQNRDFESLVSQKPLSMCVLVNIKWRSFPWGAQEMEASRAIPEHVGFYYSRSRGTICSAVCIIPMPIARKSKMPATPPNSVTFRSTFSGMRQNERASL